MAAIAPGSVGKTECRRRDASGALDARAPAPPHPGEPDNLDRIGASS